MVKPLEPSRYDYLFVLVGDGRKWFIPSEEVGGRSGLLLGGPKYARFEVDREHAGNETALPRRLAA